MLQPPVLGQRFAPALGFRGPGRLKAGLLTVASTARTRPSRFPNGGLSSLRTASAITAAVPFGACTRFPILRRIPDENGGTSSPVLLKLILESVKKLEKLFIAPKARQILHETAHRALARCECAQHMGFLMKYFHQESVSILLRKRSTAPSASKSLERVGSMSSSLFQKSNASNTYHAPSYRNRKTSISSLTKESISSPS